MTTPRWHRTAGDPLDQQVGHFAEEINSLIHDVLIGVPDILPGRASEQSDRWVITPVDVSGRRTTIPLFVAEERIAELDLSYKCRLDTHGEWLRIDSSTFAVRALVDRTPVVRFEFLEAAHTSPSAHLHVHAQRGALTHMLSKAGHPTPHAMDSLHFPLGGTRFRPCLEDVLQMLIQEFGVDAQPDWEPRLRTGRVQWRRTQLAAAVRDCPEEAVRVLVEHLGYSVEVPAMGAVEPHINRMGRW